MRFILVFADRRATARTTTFVEPCSIQLKKKQETKWSASEKEVLMQHIPGLQIAESLATPTPGGHWSGGVAVLVPPGYVLKDSHNLVQGRAVAALIADRTSQDYIVSVYLHPDKVRQDLAALLQALQGLASPDARIILAGGFNRADERCVGAWDSFLEILHVYDVFPSLGTFRHPRGLSPLDRCLVPNDWVSSARWNPSLCAIEPRGAQGHLILKMQVRLKPCVLNSPSDPKHATIPSNTFMPGKDGSTPRDISSLYGLVRLLHRQHNKLFAGIPQRDGFVLQDPHLPNDCIPSLEYVIPDRSEDYCIPPLPCDLHVESWLPHAGMCLPVLLRVAVKLVRVMIPTPTLLLVKSLLLLKTCKTMQELLRCCLF